MNEALKKRRCEVVLAHRNAGPTLMKLRLADLFNEETGLEVKNRVATEIVALVDDDGLDDLLHRIAGVVITKAQETAYGKEKGKKEG